MVLIDGQGVCATGPLDIRLTSEGYKYLEQGRLAEAECCLKQALAANPDNAYAVLNLAVVFHRSGRREEAALMYRRVMGMNPEATAGESTDAGAVGKTLGQIAQENLAELEATTLR